MRLYRIIKDDHAGYECQVKTFWGWKQIGSRTDPRCNTSETLEEAEDLINWYKNTTKRQRRRYRENARTQVIKYL